MSASSAQATKSEPTSSSPSGSAPAMPPAPNPWKEISQPFVDLVHAPRALWGVNVGYFLEGVVYWGILNYLSFYFSDYVGLSDALASPMVGVLTFGITLSQAFLGGVADRRGVRFAMLSAFALMIVGRAVLSLVPGLGLAGGSIMSPANLVALFGILFVVVGYGMYQPSAYAAVREFSSEKQAAMGFAMLYALSNLGGWLPTFFGPVREKLGISGTYWIYTGLTGVALAVTSVILSRRTVEKALVEARRARELEGSAKPKPKEEPKASVVKEAFSLGGWLRSHPLADPKFSFFIFCLIPVQTLFAHNWLTLPKYVARAFHGTWIGEHFEVAVSFNPLLIFILVPIVTALTQKANVYRMMIIGTLVMAAPTFLLALGTNFWLLAAYLILSTLGEAMWQPRFLQYAAEIAPEGRTGIYMGVAQIPWVLTKVITAAYAGLFLEAYCPAPGQGVVLQPERMWFIHACVAMLSTIMLVLARGWLGKDFKTKAA